MGTARPLAKVDRLHNTDWHARCLKAERELRETRVLLAEAIVNTNRFHALMLKARVELITRGSS